MDIVQILAKDCVICGARAADKPHLLQDLARRASEHLNLPLKAVLDPLLTREKLGSTGLGQGFALPHASVAGLRSMFGMFVKLNRPINFDAIDEKPVDLVFLLLIPADMESDHVAALAAISRRVRDQTCAAQLRKADTPEAVYAVLTHCSEKPC